MGMFNEVYADCPSCGRYKGGYLQVSQYVMGFGDFYLNDTTTLRDLSDEDLESLMQEIKDDSFICERDHLRPTTTDDDEGEGCGHYFNPVTGEGYPSESARKKKTIKELFPYV